MKILIIDDDESIRNLFLESIELWNGLHKGDQAIAFDEPDFIKDADEARRVIEASALLKYDGLVVDLRFKDAIKGDELLDVINQRLLRIPVVVYTGTPDSVRGLCYKVCTKSEVKADDILAWFFDVKMSGLMAVIGRQGCIERKLQDVFFRFQTYSLDRWAELGKSCGTNIAERSAMRYILMHLLDSLYLEDDKVFPDEFFLRVATEGPLKTGDILLKNKEYYLVISPACDLVVRECGVTNTEFAVLLKLVSTEDAAECKVRERIAKFTKQVKDNSHKKPTEADLQAQKEKVYSGFRFEKEKKPRTYEYVHAIPSVAGIGATYVAFRTVTSVPYDKVFLEFARTGLRVAPPFLKDIQSRFASYYARQGQPDINYSLEANSH